MKGRIAEIVVGLMKRDKDGCFADRTAGGLRAPAGNLNAQNHGLRTRGSIAELGATPLPVILIALLSAVAMADDPKPPFQNYELTDEEIAMALEGEGCVWSGAIRNVFYESEQERKEMDRLRRVPLSSEQEGPVLTEAGFGLILRDSKSDKWASGISIRVLTPYSWICEQAKEAERRYTPLTVEDVTEDMRRGVLRVYASPGKILHNPKKHDLREYGMTRVTIRSTAKKGYEVLEPISVEEDSEWQSAENIDERRTHYPELMVTFDLQQVAEISNLDKKGEIFVVLTNSLGKERKLKIKTKHFEKLP